MKRLIKYLLAMVGYKITKNQVTDLKNRMHMSGSIEWLSTHGIEVATVLDVGASNGCWSEICMTYYPDSKYILYEPQPVHVDGLCEFSRQHDNVELVLKAIGESPGTTNFDISDPFGGALCRGAGLNTVEVEMTSIDTSVEDLKLNGPFLLKLDTHGYEKSILKGSSKTLRNCSVLIIEAYNYIISPECILFWELCDYLKDKGFRPIDCVDVMHRPYDSSLWQMDLVFISEEWDGFSCNSYE